MLKRLKPVKYYLLIFKDKNEKLVSKVKQPKDNIIPINKNEYLNQSNLSKTKRSRKRNYNVSNNHVSNSHVRPLFSGINNIDDSNNEKNVDLGVNSKKTKNFYK